MLECNARLAGNASATHFCPAPDATALLAVLGIFSVERNMHARLEIRTSWLALYKTFAKFFQRFGLAQISKKFW